MPCTINFFGAFGIHRCFYCRAQQLIDFIRRYGQVPEFERQKNRAGVKNGHCGAISPGLPHGHRQHRCFVERIGAHNRNKVCRFNLAQRDHQIGLESGNSGFHFASAGRICKINRRSPVFCLTHLFQHGQGFKTAAAGTCTANCFRAIRIHDGFQLLFQNMNGLIDRYGFTINSCRARPFFQAGIEKSITPPVADKMAIDGSAEPRLLPDDFPIAGTGYRKTAQRAVNTYRGTAPIVPASAEIA